MTDWDDLEKIAKEDESLKEVAIVLKAIRNDIGKLMDEEGNLTLRSEIGVRPHGIKIRRDDAADYLRMLDGVLVYLPNLSEDENLEKVSEFVNEKRKILLVNYKGLQSLCNIMRKEETNPYEPE